ncbi:MULTISPECIES: helix-turn-helix transcriptional regulator [Shewanella]|uniref:Helix-turn-helix domain containing protein n=1 Tax=Shewanella cutis TaxID=2766780 RepID=A0ABS9QUH2_9GAMM|nr:MULTISPECIES: helix-turn-helix transcriptional regulator [Shewanella]KEK29104.1 bacteriophage CI repressor [Shewanella xiamenensis]MCG9963996.1 helix-turn-helix domain containing protein [Shewanella sp. PS-2]
MSDFYKLKNNKFRYPLDKPIQYEGGKVIIERLIHLFKVSNRLELAELIGVTPATLSTWTTRNTTPHELIIRLHLAMNTPVEYLCFGTGRSFGVEIDEGFVVGESAPKYTALIEPDEAYKMPILTVCEIENGALSVIEKFRMDSGLFFLNSIQPNTDDFLLKDAGRKLFINARETVVTKGRYLFSVNGAYQVGDLRQMPDGNTYFFDGDDKYPINPNATKIHGKVVSVIETV